MKKILLTGPPRIGKTTIVKKVACCLQKKGGYPLKGFYTEEIRNNYKKRVGFKLVTFQGVEKILAHISFSSPYRVSKYGVDIQALEEILDLIYPVSSDEIIIIDEIGKMECFSKRFKDIILEVLKLQNRFLGTIALKGDPFIETIKKMPAIKLIQVTLKNRDELPLNLKKEFN